ncbi:hypothetical protein [Macrococcus sp. DPC7161]|uniref:hypothetical protein n=1 Tax=Macrococcus sp. DPC7161 TaxID=2507060 RepID=UPI00100BD2BA|nr:hypothetical protein [Macrococcus sp. DPC7161]RXK17625.1 hypothetical protein ER639_08785 [Macrococcus sp. DPC7161]
MHYFVGINIPLGITGIERAIFNRLYLFKKYNIPAKLLFTDFLPFFNHHAEIYHVAEDTLYMYDYFQNAIGYKNEVSTDWLSRNNEDALYETVRQFLIDESLQLNIIKTVGHQL